MKSFTLFIIVLTFSLGSCRNTLPKQTQEGSSRLKAVYDNDYSLKVAKSPEEPQLYQFETCLTPAHLNKHGSNLSSKDSCVAALKVGGENITFQIETGTLEELALSEKELESLLKMQHEWRDYKAKTAETIVAGATSPLPLTLPAAGAAVLLDLDITYERLDLKKIIRENPGTERAMKAARKLGKMTWRTPIIIGLIVGASAAAAYGVININNIGLLQAKDRFEKKKLQTEEFNVLLQSSSPLLSTDPFDNKKVDSIKAVLSYLAAMAWSGANAGSQTIHYCYPKITTENTVEPDCHHQ